MNKRIEQLMMKAMAKSANMSSPNRRELDPEKFAKLIVSSVLDAVEDRAYAIGDRTWSNEIDRKWVELEFSMGKLAELKNE